MKVSNIYLIFIKGQIDLNLILRQVHRFQFRLQSVIFIMY